MKHLTSRNRLILLAVLAVLVLVVAVPVVAQTGGTFDLTWSTVDGGGATSTGGTFTLNGTIGQADAGTAMTGGTYSLVGGFWGGASAGPSSVYLPLIMK